MAAVHSSVSEGRYRFAVPTARDNLNVIGMAHEIGHLLGAHHHYGNCSEGRSPVPLSPGSCTAMLALGTLNGEVFGSLERAVIRGYVEQLAPRPSP